MKGTIRVIVELDGVPRSELAYDLSAADVRRILADAVTSRGPAKRLTEAVEYFACGALDMGLDDLRQCYDEKGRNLRPDEDERGSFDDVIDSL